MSRATRPRRTSSCVPMSEELGKAGLRIQSRCKKEGTGAVVLVAQIRRALLKEDRHRFGKHLVSGVFLRRSGTSKHGTGGYTWLGGTWRTRAFRHRLTVQTPGWTR